MLAQCGWTKCSANVILVDSAVATERPGGASPPISYLCLTHFGLLKILFLGTPPNDKTTDTDGKRNNNDQT